MFDYLQEQFRSRKVQKEYIALVVGIVKEDRGVIDAPLGRAPSDRRKQKAYPLSEEKPGLREAVTEYKVLQRYQGYTLLELYPKTGRKHQIRAHMVFLNNPIAKDKLYSFKEHLAPEGLTRQFLHAASLRISLPAGTQKEFSSQLPQEFQTVLQNLQSL